jgi:hypothetical protein
VVVMLSAVVVCAVHKGADDKLYNTQLQLTPVMYLLLELSDPLQRFWFCGVVIML